MASVTRDGHTVLTLNAGSSSIKFAWYRRVEGVVTRVATGETESGAAHHDLLGQVDGLSNGAQPDAIGHRIVHGGPALFRPVEIDSEITAQLDAARAFAPLHVPAALALIASARARYPGKPQIACFDTGFHATLPDIAAVLPVPRTLRARGVRRYGFHGLSCQSILHQLGDRVPERLIIAHLGSGASVTAVRRGVSIDTSMGLTPSGGVVMATRSGDIDPGVLLFLLREDGVGGEMIETLIDRQSGLLGISGLSGDMRRLHEAAPANPDAALAIAIFCRSVAKQIAGMLASLGGAEMIVFTGGIGENDARIRAAICGDLAWAGVAPGATGPGAIAVNILPSDEQGQIARGIWSVLDERPA